MSLHHSPRIVTDGLVLYLDAGNIKSYPGSGSYLYDLSYRPPTGNRTGTLLGGPPSYSSGSFTFDGTYDRIKWTTEYVAFASTYDFTWSAWVYPTSTSDEAAISRISIADDYMGIAGGKVFVSRAQGAGNVTGGTVTINNWWNIVGSGDSQKLYVSLNGQEVNSGNHTTAFTAGFLSWCLGCLHDAYVTVASGFSGKIAVASVYNRCLTPTEILQNYNALKGRFGL